MHIVFVSNYFNHHIMPVCKALYEKTDGNFHFIATERMKEERKNLGYREMDDEYDFIIKAYDESEYPKALKLCLECDALIYGMAPAELVKKRLKTGKLTYKCSERVYKKKCPWYEIPLRAVKYYFQFARYKNLYLLCASAYTAGDYAKTGTFLNKAFKWGYFPKTYEYDIEKIVREKKKNSILWVGRFLDFKHPELAIEVVQRLKKDGFDLTLDIIGTGDLEDNMKALIEKYDLQNEVNLLGTMTPEGVRTYMEKTEIFLFTTDRTEGWGAVLNESMNSGCAVVASSAIGAVPYLLEDGQNGCVYEYGNFEDLYQKVKFLIEKPNDRIKMAKKAYETIKDEWNAEKAATRLIELSNSIANNGNAMLFGSGVCSKSDILK